MKIIAFGGSPSKNSINKKLATYAASLFENAEVEVLTLNDFEMPLFTVRISWYTAILKWCESCVSCG